MGSSTILDILGSLLIGGMIIVSIITVNGNLAKINYNYGSEMRVQENLVTLVTLIEQDFRRIGYCAIPLKFPDPTKALLLATKNSIKFIGDYNADGNLDTIYYYLGDTSTARFTKNPHDKLLYKKINSGNPTWYSLGVVTFDFTYYDAQADSLAFPISTPSQVYSFRLSVLLQSPEAYDTNYQYAYWRQLRLSAINLRNR